MYLSPEWETLRIPAPPQKLFNKMVPKFSPGKLKPWKLFSDLKKYSILKKLTSILECRVNFC